MTSSPENKRAKQLLKTLCDMLDEYGTDYKRSDDLFAVWYKKAGKKEDDMPVLISFKIDVKRQIICLTSPIPFRMDKSKLFEGAIATCAVTYTLSYGSFDYDMSDGTISFRLTAPYEDCEIGKELFEYMIFFADMAVRKYNRQFWALNSGETDITQFINNV